MAYSSIPPAYQAVSLGGGYTAPTFTTCSGYGYAASCVSTGGGYTPPTVIQIDANANTREQVFSGCMNGDGWWLRKQDEINRSPTSTVATFRTFDVKCKIPNQEAIGTFQTEKECIALSGEVIR